MVTRAKKRRQQRAQSRLALARHKQQERARRQAAAAQRAEHQWHKTLRQLAALGATLQEDGVSTDGNGHPAYKGCLRGKHLPLLQSSAHTTLAENGPNVVSKSKT